MKLLFNFVYVAFIFIGLMGSWWLVSALSIQTTCSLSVYQ